MGCENKPAVGEKPRIVFVIGGPGCGKGTQCKRIVQNFKYQSFSTGDLLRQYVKDKKDGYEEIENQMKEGKLISSSTLMKVLLLCSTSLPSSSSLSQRVLGICRKLHSLLCQHILLFCANKQRVHQQKFLLDMIMFQ